MDKLIFIKSFENGVLAYKVQTFMSGILICEEEKSVEIGDKIPEDYLRDRYSNVEVIEWEALCK